MRLSVISHFLTLLSPFLIVLSTDSWDDVRKVVSLEHCETLPIVEAVVKIGHFNAEFEVVEQSGLSKNVADGVTVGETVHHQVLDSIYACVERNTQPSPLWPCHSRGRCLVFITGVGLQVEVSDALHLLKEHFEDILLEKRFSVELMISR